MLYLIHVGWATGVHITGWLELSVFHVSLIRGHLATFSSSFFFFLNKVANHKSTLAVWVGKVTFHFFFFYVFSKFPVLLYSFV